MYLIAGSTPFSNWERVLPLLQRAGCACPAATSLEKWRAGAKGGAANVAFREACAELLNGCDSPAVLAVDPSPLNGVPLDFWVGEFADTHLLLLHSRPERFLAQAMAENREPKELLEQWQSAAEKLLQYYRRNRARATLIDVDCALTAPELFSQACHDYLRLKNAPVSPGSHPESSAAAVRTDIYQLIAQQMVAQSSELNDLLAELEAGSWPLGEPPLPSLDCQRIYHDYRKLQDQSEQASKHDQEQAENRRKELEEENELLLLQLHQVQEELERYYLQLQEEKENFGRSEKRLKALERKISYMENSKSWKITRPLRGVIKPFMKKPAKDNPA